MTSILESTYSISCAVWCRWNCLAAFKVLFIIFQLSDQRSYNLKLLVGMLAYCLYNSRLNTIYATFCYQTIKVWIALKVYAFNWAYLLSFHTFSGWCDSLLKRAWSCVGFIKRYEGILPILYNRVGCGLHIHLFGKYLIYCPLISIIFYNVFLL